jgi:hypothetical protein
MQNFSFQIWNLYTEMFKEINPYPANVENKVNS